METKICGITNIEDAALAAKLGVDALGFIFYPGSPRYVAPDTVKMIIEGLSDERPAIVGVFVNEKVETVREITGLCGLDMIQLHGDESESYCRQFPASKLIKALSPAMMTHFKDLKNYPAKAILIDARDAERYGGTGKPSDWEAARKIAFRQPVILAGGLSEANIVKAIENVSPHAVDINSGIESVPGKKDEGKVRKIVEIIHTIELPQHHKALKIFKKK